MTSLITSGTPLVTSLITSPVTLLVISLSHTTGHILSNSSGGGGIPVEAEAVQTLFAWLVNRVESGAGILLLPAIWTPPAPSDPLNYCLVTSKLLPFLPRGPGSVGSVSSSDSDITHV